MAYKMKGFGGFGNSPIKQTKFPDSPKGKTKLDILFETPKNERSIRLIKRLGFKYVGEKDELEINGETRTYETYLLSA